MNGYFTFHFQICTAEFLFWHYFSGQSGEISVKEYYNVGQVTEFRYVIKISEGVKGGFYGLQGVYDEVISLIHPCIHSFIQQFIL